MTIFPQFLVGLIIVAVVVSLALWVIENLPIDPVLVRVLRVAIIALTIIWVLDVIMGLLPSTYTLRY